MRNFWLTLAAGLLIGSVVRAQPAAPPAPAPGLDPARNRLDAVLLRWEQEMKAVQTLSAQCNLTRVDKVLQDTEIFEGVVEIMKPNMALLDLKKKGKPEIFMKYVCTGAFCYEYVPQNKVIRIHDMSAPRNGPGADDGFLAFLNGMKAEEVKRRYDLRLVKEDQWYVYVEILPRIPADKADFKKARLVLSNQNFLPRELWFEEPNGNEVKWDIPKMASGVPVPRTDFTAPSVPTGWTQVKMPRSNSISPRADVPPRVFRPNQ